MNYKKQNLEYYCNLFKKNKYSPQSLGWKNKKSAFMRFNDLISNFFLKENSILNKKNSILDVGCGLGYLIDDFRIKNFFYTGIDINNNFIELNKKKFPKKYSFICGDFLELKNKKKYDYIVQSGLLNYKVKLNKYSYAEMFLRKMFHLSNIAISCNFLSTKARIKHKKNFYYDPEKILKICYKMTNNLILKNDTFPFEFTVVLFKNKKIDKLTSTFAYKF